MHYIIQLFNKNFKNRVIILIFREESKCLGRLNTYFNCVTFLKVTQLTNSGPGIRTQPVWVAPHTVIPCDRPTLLPDCLVLAL